MEVRVNKANMATQLRRIPRTIRRRLTLFCLAVVVLLCAGPSATAEEKADPKAAAADQAGERPGNKASAPETSPKLSFTDEDLKKYQRPRADDEEDAAILEGIEEEGTGTRPVVPQGAPLVRTPLKIAKPPADDPLKEYKDREARDKFRAQQIETLRERISTLEARLAYLQQKRLAIIDPLRIMPQAQSADESAKDAGLGSGDLLAEVEAEIESNETALKSAQDNLVTIQIRFGAQAR